VRHRKVGEKLSHFSRSHLSRMALVVEQDISLDPVNVGLFCAIAIMSCADEYSYAVKEFGHSEVPLHS
jgi:hypothetical protein